MHGHRAHSIDDEESGQCRESLLFPPIRLSLNFNVMHDRYFSQSAQNSQVDQRHGTQPQKSSTSSHYFTYAPTPTPYVHAGYDLLILFCQLPRRLCTNVLWGKEETEAENRSQVPIHLSWRNNPSTQLPVWEVSWPLQLGWFPVLQLIGV